MTAVTNALAGLLLAFGPMACRTPEPPAAGQTVRLPGAERWLMVTGSEPEGAQWSLKEGSRIQRIPPPPVTLFPVGLSPSPDGRYLAVLSVGEGHPILDVLSLPRVLEGTHGELPLRTIDPYPGSIELAGWEGTKLKVLSDRPLTTCCDSSGRAPGSEVLEHLVLFRIDPETGRITKE